MDAAEPYNDAVRMLFENPSHAGDLQSDYAEVLRSEAAESEHGARVLLFAGIADGMIAEMRFRAWGCPHLIAAAEMLCDDRENGPVSGLSGFDRNAMMTQLFVPVEKTGKMLLLEDALESLWAAHRAAA
jgi:NifU-like protein involved in Fe-S cluster formation